MGNDQNESIPGPTVGGTVDLPHDRMTVERFREAFPRARWSDNRKAWFVPGRTADRRIRNWLAKLEAEADAFADEKGRDAFQFDPIDSPYLEATQGGFRIRTPYSRTVVAEVREIPFARWEADDKYWFVPFRSFEDLRQRWLAIEDAALRNEPAERKARQDALRGSDAAKAQQARARERRLRRYPVPVDEPPPFDRAIGTHMGVVFFENTDGEIAESETVSAHYFPAATDREYVWAHWSRGSLENLVATSPARHDPAEAERSRGWWSPTLDELRAARKEARRKPAPSYKP